MYAVDFVVVVVAIVVVVGPCVPVCGVSTCVCTIWFSSTTVHETPFSPFSVPFFPQQATHVIAQSKSAATPISADVMSDMLSAQQQLQSPVDWRSGGKHKMKGMQQKQMVQRSNVSADNVYTTKARKMKKGAFL